MLTFIPTTLRGRMPCSHAAPQLGITAGPGGDVAGNKEWRVADDQIIHPAYKGTNKAGKFQ